MLKFKRPSLCCVNSSSAAEQFTKKADFLEIYDLTHLDLWKKSIAQRYGSRRCQHKSFFLSKLPCLGILRFIALLVGVASLSWLGSPGLDPATPPSNKQAWAPRTLYNWLQSGPLVNQAPGWQMDTQHQPLYIDLAGIQQHPRYGLWIQNKPIRQVAMEK